MKLLRWSRPKWNEYEIIKSLLMKYIYLTFNKIILSKSKPIELDVNAIF